jgi:dihydroorotase
MQKPKILLKGGEICASEGTVKQDLLIHNQRIAEIGANIVDDDALTINCQGMHILPGLIDAHVHFRVPGAPWKEDFLSGSRAAAAGGVTTVLDMPNTDPPVKAPSDLEHKRSFAQKSLVNYGFHVLGCYENRHKLGEFSNIAGVKVYLGSTTGDFLTEDLGTLAEILINSPFPVIVHAENEALIRFFGEQNKGSELHHVLRDGLCAAVSTAESVLCARRFSKRLHLAHVSTSEEINLIRKLREPWITCEVSPHHLFLDEKFFLEKRGLGKMNPPLRVQEDVKALWQGIWDETVDMIASDHAPHTMDEKGNSYHESPCGVPGVQTSAPLLLNAVSQGKLNLRHMVALCCENPARVFGIQERGSLKEGFFADLCLVDLKRRQVLKNENMESRCCWTPFHGMSVKGTVTMTFVNGSLVFDRGRFHEDIPGQEVVFDNRKEKGA